MSFAYLVSLLMLGSIAFALVREMRKTSPRPAGLRGHIRARGWGLVLLPAAAMAAVMTGHVHALAVAELAIAGALVTWAPRLAAKLAPYAVLALALFGLILAKAYQDGFSSQVLYGLVPAGGGPFRRGFVLPQAGAFFVLGMWLLLRVEAPGAGPVRALIARWLDPRRGGISSPLGLLLVPVTAAAVLLIGPRYWFGLWWMTKPVVVLVDAAILTASLVLVFRSRVWAATVAEAGLLVLGAYSSPRSGPRCRDSGMASPRWPARATGPSARPCRAPRCSRWGCGWRRGSCASTRSSRPTPSSRPGPSS
jgi:hypothetical protein